MWISIVAILLLHLANAWTVYDVTEIAVSVSNYRNIPCISIFNSGNLSDQEERIVFQTTKSMQKKWKLTRKADISDYSSSEVWRGCSALMTVIFGHMSTARESFPDIIKKKHSRLAVFLLFLPDDATAEKYIGNTILPFLYRILVASHGDQQIVIRQVWRVYQGFAMRSVIYGNWTNVEGLVCPRIACPFFRRDNLEGAPLRASTKEDNPISYLIRTETNNLQIKGYFGAVYDAIVDVLNMTAIVVKAVENATGSEENGEWNGLLGMLVRNEIDLVVGPNTIHQSSLPAAGFVRPLLRSSFQVFFKQEETIMEWSAYAKPFQAIVWYSVLLWFVLGSYLFNFFYLLGVSNEREDATYSNEFSTTNSLLLYFKTFCQQGTDVVPSSLSCRAWYLISSLTSFVLLTAYSGSLISKLTTQAPLRPFDSLETFLKDASHTMIAIERSTDYMYFTHTTDPLLVEIFNKKMLPYPKDKLPTGKEEGLSAVCKGQKIALFIVEAATILSLESYKIKENCRILYLSHPIGVAFLTMAARKEMPFTRAIDQKLELMMETGVLQRLKNRAWPLQTAKTYEITTPPAVELKQVAPLYCILLLGIIIAFSVLMVEIAMSHKNSNKMALDDEETSHESHVLIHLIFMAIIVTLILSIVSSLR